MEITTTKASITLSEASYALPPSTKARACTQHAPSVEVVPVPVRRATHKKWGSHPSAGIVHCGHGGVLFSIAEESSVAKDHRSRTRTTRPRCASSCRARRGESASKRAPHERSGAERVSDLVSTPRKTRQQSIHPLKHQGIPAARETRPAKDEATAKTPSARVIKSRARAAQYAALMDKARAFRVKSILGFWSRAATPGAPAQPPPPLLPPALPRPPTPPPLPPPPEPQASAAPLTPRQQERAGSHAKKHSRASPSAGDSPAGPRAKTHVVRAIAGTAAHAPRPAPRGGGGGGATAAAAGDATAVRPLAFCGGAARLLAALCHTHWHCVRG